jgi:endo-1,4-beta-xylanase
MITRRAALISGAAALAAPAFAQTPSLRALAAAKGILFGSAAATYELKDADFIALLPQQAAILVPEYEMKRDVVEPLPGAYDFSGCDGVVNFAQAHGLQIRGHPLVWHYANPPWLEDAVRARRDARLLTNYVSALARRYRGRMHSHDVINEALVPPDEGATGWRPCFWLDVFGPAYLDLAFHAAREADPSALLIYNDAGCEQDTPGHDLFRKHVLELLDGLLKRNVPVQGMGLQAHLAAFGPKVNQRKLRAFLDEIASRKLAILVTELDVDDEGGPRDLAVRDQAVADEARRFLDVALDNLVTRTVLTWGLTDRYLDPPQSWRLKLSGWKDRRLAYDSQLRPKPLHAALTQAFQAARPRPGAR